MKSIMNKLSLLLIFTLFTGINCSFMYDFFDILQIDLNNPKKYAGLASVAGPSVGDKPAIQFSDGADKIAVTPSDANGNMFGNIMHSLANNDDATFAVRFKLDGVDLTKNAHRIALLAFSQKINNILGEKQIFEIVLHFEDNDFTGEGVDAGQKRKFSHYSQTVCVNKRMGDDVKENRFRLSKEQNLSLGKWAILMVRILKNEATVYISPDNTKCSTVKGKIEGDSFADLPLTGIIRLGQKAVTKNSVDVITEKFVGDMYYPRILLGTKAFELLNSCDPQLKKTEIPNELSNWKYDPTNFNHIREMIDSTSGNSPSFKTCSVQSCDKATSDQETLTMKSSETITPNQLAGGRCVSGCRAYTCNDGTATYKYTCSSKCKQNGNEYEGNEEWIAKEQGKCVKYFCQGGRRLRKDSSFQCPALKCNESPDGPMDAPDGSCCQVCKSSQCRKDQVYTNSCDKACTEGPRKQCESKTEGCFCADKFALNEKATCVSLSRCQCQSGSVTYQAGQSVKRSECETCMCLLAKFRCKKKCFI